jgi:hypothetical protein
MPGGRLTSTDRRRIADGLAEGQGFAEIARDLGRPTSTVSREVGRNGGAERYRAEPAQRATGHRARRRRPAARNPSGTSPSASGDFAEEFAGLLVASGLPRMASRVLASLVTTDDGALSAAELVDRLRVSPASVSKAVAYLEGLALISRETDAHRRQRYVIDDDVWVQTWTSSAQRHADWAAAAQRGAAIYGAGTPVGTRLANMGRFFGQLSQDMAGGPDGSEVADMVTVLAALLATVTPRAAGRLAATLGWPTGRVEAALRLASDRVAGP